MWGKPKGRLQEKKARFNHFDNWPKKAKSKNTF